MVLAFSCPHCPFQEEEAVEWFLRLVREIRPTQVVCLGDLLEAESASKFEKEDPPDLEEEFFQATVLLRRLRETASSSQLVMLEGNHDDNLRRKGRIPKAWRSMLVPDVGVLGDELKNWRVYPYENSERGIHRVGNVGFVHGYSHGVSSDRDEAVQFNSSRPGSLLVRGHTHRPCDPTQVWLTKKIPLPYWYANAGTLGRLKPDWTSRLDTRLWGHAAVLVEVNRDGSWKAQTLRK